MMNNVLNSTRVEAISHSMPKQVVCMRGNRRLIRLASARLIIIFLFPFMWNTATAQEEFIQPPAQHLTSFPFTLLSGGIVVIKAVLDDMKDSLNFVLDTGSGGISLDSATCEYYKFKKVPSNRLVRGIAGVHTVDFTYNHTLHLTGLDVDKLDFHINDYEILTSSYGLKIDGIIGFSFLRRYIVAINYDNSTIDVFTPGTFKYPRGGYMLKPQFSTLPMQNAIVKDASTINSKFYFDIGAGLCMLLTDDLVKDSNLLNKKRKIYKTQAEGLGGKKQMMLSVVKEIRLGPYKFRNVPVHIFGDEFNLTSYPVLGGLIGNDVLRRFNITLNYPEQEIFIKPNKHYLDSFDYSYTGLSMYVTNGVITITDIIENSPAQAAGFKVGDVVLSVDNNFSNNIQTYKVMLQNPKSKIDVLVLRNGSPEMLTIKIKNILRRR